MRFALSTNWCSRRIDKGEEIVEKAIALGFEALELGFHLTDTQAAEIRKCGKLPVESVHAFCPVPISAPCGYPELYSLASFDDETRKMAHFQIVKNIRFAAEMGATALVLHAGRIKRTGLFKKRRLVKMREIFKVELSTLLPELEARKVVLGLENMPYAEGFPNCSEIGEFTGDWVRPWFDTGHAHVLQEKPPENVIGCHINDSNGGDDHLPPGVGKIDFKALKPLFEKTSHLVFEPNEGVSDEQLLGGIEFLRKL